MTIARPENRTELLQAFRDYYDLNNAVGNTSIVGRNQLERFLDTALDSYSSRRPVEGLETTLVITSGSRDVPLTKDWLVGFLPNERILLAIERGEDPDNLQEDYGVLDFGGSSNRYNGNLSYGNPFDPINQTLSRPLTRPNPRQERPTINRKWVDGVLLPVWVLRRATLPSQEVTVKYFGKHRVEDGADDEDSINTVYEGDEHIIYQIMNVLCVGGKGHSAFAEGRINNPLDFIKGAREEINAILATITSTSIRR